MTCTQTELLLSKYLEEELSPAQYEEIRLHLETCVACRFKLQVLEDCRLLDEDGEVPAAFSENWRQAINYQEVAPVKQLPMLRKWLALAAALFVLVGGTWLAGQNRINTSHTATKSIESAAGDTANYGAAPMAIRESSILMADQASDMDLRGAKEASQAAKIIRTARVELSTRQFEQDYASILSTLKQAGGWVESTDLYNNYTGYRSLQLSLRIPVEKLDEVIASLKSVGRLVSYNESAQDVSEQYTDTQTRLITQQTKMQRLQDLLKKAESVEDLITIEGSISDTQYQIDSLTGSLKGLDSRVNDATLSLSLNELGPLETSQDQEESLLTRIQSAMQAAWAAFVTILGDFLVFLSVILPYLLVLIILVLIIRHLIKRRKK